MDAAALADAPSLDAFEAARRAQARFYGFGARALNLVFQNDWTCRRGRGTPDGARSPGCRGCAAARSTCCRAARPDLSVQCGLDVKIDVWTWT